MAEIVFLLGLVAPFVLMVWLMRTRNRSQAKAADLSAPEIELDRFATEQVDGAVDGLVMGRQHYADHEIIPPDHSGGEPAGIRAMQGRR